MFKKTTIVVSAALALSLPATAALAADDADDQPTTVATCEQAQERAQLRTGTGTGDCVEGHEPVQARTMTRDRDEAFSPVNCTGDRPQARAGNAAGNGDGPQARAGNGNQFGRAGS